MQCPNCGTIIINSNFCGKCGTPVTNQVYNQPVSNQPISNQTNKKTLPFIIGGAVIILIIILIVLFGGKKDKYIGSWDCKGYTASSGVSNSYLVSMEINSNGKYKFGQYNDLANNRFSGTYTAKYESDKKKQYNKDFYLLDFNIDEYIVNGKNQNQTSKMEFEMEFIKDDEFLMVNAYSLAMYYCYKK